MREQSTERLIESRPSWEVVEAFARQSIQTGVVYVDGARRRAEATVAAP